MYEEKEQADVLQSIAEVIRSRMKTPVSDYDEPEDTFKSARQQIESDTDNYPT